MSQIPLENEMIHPAAIFDSVGYQSNSKVNAIPTSAKSRKTRNHAANNLKATASVLKERTNIQNIAKMLASYHSENT